MKSTDRIIWKNLAKNWAHQALTYMDRGERTVRLIFELLSICLVYYIMKKLVFYHTGFSTIALLLSFILVHTSFWLFNCNIWALLLFSFPTLRNRGEKNTCNYLNGMQGRLSKSACVTP